MSEGSSPYHTSEDGLEGATGYNASMDGHGMSGGYVYHRQRGEAIFNSTWLTPRCGPSVA